jgi:8-amino-3,8-dideoxy-alpha-D-manno-octulosonate transaminase
MNELTAAMLRVQLGRLPALLDEMRSVKAALTEIIRAYSHVRCIAGEDPRGDPGTLLTLQFDSEDVVRRFQQSLFVSAIKARLALRSLPLTDYGLHLYFQNSSLVKKRSICGHHSVWQLAENEFARDYSYAKGVLPVLDGLVSRTLLFATPVGLSSQENEDLLSVFRSSCDRSSGLQGTGER